MGSQTTPPKLPDLLPVPWERIEPHYVAGIRSVKSISKEFGVSRPAIDKHALKHGWVRNLKPQIHAKAAELVAQKITTAVASPGCSPTGKATERHSVDVNAEVLASIQYAHQTIGADLRDLGASLMLELGAATRTPELFAHVADVLSHCHEEEPSADDKAALREVIQLLSNLPGRVKTFKALVESMSRVQGMEREAFGLNAEDGTGGDRFTVIVKDYTGQGSGLVAKPVDESDDDR